MDQSINSKGMYLSLEDIQLISTIQRLWIEHVMWTRFFIISTVLNLPDLEYVTKRLLENPTDFANLLEKYYGKEVAAQFEKLFTAHLLIAAQLLNASKAGDTKTADEQRTLWYENADEIIQFLSNINPYWDKETWQNMFYDHLKMTEEEAVLILTQKYEESIKLFDKIEKQAVLMANVMATGMLKQFE